MEWNNSVICPVVLFLTKCVGGLASIAAYGPGEVCLSLQKEGCGEVQLSQLLYPSKSKTHQSSTSLSLRVSQKSLCILCTALPADFWKTFADFWQNLGNHIIITVPACSVMMLMRHCLFPETHFVYLFVCFRIKKVGFFSVPPNIKCREVEGNVMYTILTEFQSPMQWI